MIRPFTCLCMVLAGASGLYLYQAKHRVQLLDREITSTLHETEVARGRIGVLRAEWTLQNDPERLAQLADRFLTLKTVTPGQFTTLAELDRRLPPVRAPEPPAEMDDATPVASMPEPEPPQVASVPEAKPETPHSERADTQHVETQRPEPQHPEPQHREPQHREVARPAVAPPPVKLATVAPHPVERRPSPVREAAFAAPPRRMATAETRSIIARVTAAVPRPVTPIVTFSPVATAPAGTSVLGITRSNIAPPVPFISQPINTGGG